MHSTDQNLNLLIQFDPASAVLGIQPKEIFLCEHKVQI